MGDMPADGGGRRDDRVAGFAGRHEGIEVGHRARGHADLGKRARRKTSAHSSAAMTSISSIASSPISYLSPG
jgi:hypothetical protein